MKKINIAAVLVLCLLMLTLSGCEKNVEFSNGKLSADNADISIVLENGETALLDNFTGLQHADLSGSDCYDEIIDWAAAHPETEVVYTVTLPDGRVIQNDCTELDLSELSSKDAVETAELISALPKLEKVALGSVNGRLSAADIDTLTAALPNAVVDGSISLLGSEYPLDTAALDFSECSADDAAEIIDTLPSFGKLESVELGCDTGSAFALEDVAAMEKAAPDVHFSYEFTAFGKELNLDTKKLNFAHVKMDDDGAEVRKILDCLPNCDYLDMDRCGVDSEHMAAIRDDYPNVEVIWRVYFGTCYSVRTNVERILASDPHGEGQLREHRTDELKYCTKVKYLDIGHNLHLANIDFVQYMPDLEVFIICGAWELTDLSPIANCKKLEYLELISATEITDISPLSGLHELKHLNISNMTSLKDITPLYNMSQLERLWMNMSIYIPREQIDEFQTLNPNCQVSATIDDPTASGWRVIKTGEYPHYNKTIAPRYALLREQFQYTRDTDCLSYYYNDPYYHVPAPTPED